MSFASLKMSIVFISLIFSGAAFADLNSDSSSLVPGTTFQCDSTINTVQIEVNADLKTAYDSIVVPSNPGQMLIKNAISLNTVN